MTGKFVHATLAQAIADGVGMAATPSNASSAGSRKISQTGEDGLSRSDRSDAGSVAGSNQSTARRNRDVDRGREEERETTLLSGKHFGQSQHGSEAVMVADDGHTASPAHDGGSDSGFDDRSVTSSAASMTGRLVRDTLQQALKDSLEMAQSPSAAGSSQTCSVIGQHDDKVEMRSSSSFKEHRGAQRTGLGGWSALKARKVKLASQQTDTWRLPLHLLCANHAITCKALAVLLEAASWAAAVPDRHGLLPLHVLCANRRVSFHLLRMLLVAFPAGARMPCGSGQLPLHYLSQSPSADADMLGLLLQAYPQGISKLGRNDSTITHLLAASKVQAGARRLRGGSLEGTDAELRRRRRRQEVLQVAVDYDNLNRELVFDLPSGPTVGADWHPAPTKIKGTLATAAGGGSEQHRFRRLLPCVVLSVKERAIRLRDSAMLSIQNSWAPSKDPAIGPGCDVDAADVTTEFEHVETVLQHPVAAVMSLLMTTDAEKRIDVERHMQSMRLFAQLISSDREPPGLGCLHDSMGRLVLEDGLARMVAPCLTSRRKSEKGTPRGFDDSDNGILLLARSLTESQGVVLARLGDGDERVWGASDAGVDKVEAEVLRQVANQVCCARHVSMMMLPFLYCPIVQAAANCAVITA